MTHVLVLALDAPDAQAWVRESGLAAQGEVEDRAYICRYVGEPALVHGLPLDTIAVRTAAFAGRPDAVEFEQMVEREGFAWWDR